MESNSNLTPKKLLKSSQKSTHMKFSLQMKLETSLISTWIILISFSKKNSFSNLLEW